MQLRLPALADDNASGWLQWLRLAGCRAIRRPNSSELPSARPCGCDGYESAGTFSPGKIGGYRSEQQPTTPWMS
jgi:hypothetical protein